MCEAFWTGKHLDDLRLRSGTQPKIRGQADCCDLMGYSQAMTGPTVLKHTNVVLALSLAQKFVLPRGSREMVSSS